MTKELSEGARLWFESRGINGMALLLGGVYSEGQGASEEIVFPYRRRGVVVNHKYRANPKGFRMDRGADLTLWNLDCLDANPDHVYFVEGEMDALSFMEAGLSNVVSVPNGAPPAEETGIPDPEHDKRYAFLRAAHPDLTSRPRRYVMAGDSDNPGRALRDALVARLGRANCDIVEWPEGIKDANEFLMEQGAQALREYVIASRKPYHIRGLAGWDDTLPVSPQPTYDIGVPVVRNAVRLARGTLSVVTGMPNHGKTAFVKHLACEMIRRHGWNVTIGSFEDRVYTQLMPELINIFSGLAPSPEPRVTIQRDQAVQALRRHVSFISDEGQVEETQDFDWVMGMARDAKIRFGTDLLILDPWNEIEHAWGRDKTETQYIGRALRDLRRLAIETDMHIMIVAHPSKIEGDEAPGLYAIAGSANWANKVDIGITVHQPDFADGPGGPTDIYVRKVKRPDFGRRGVFRVQFDAQSRRFEAP